MASRRKFLAYRNASREVVSVKSEYFRKENNLSIQNDDPRKRRQYHWRKHKKEPFTILSDDNDDESEPSDNWILFDLYVLPVGIPYHPTCSLTPAAIKMFWRNGSDTSCRKHQPSSVEGSNSFFLNFSLISNLFCLRLFFHCLFCHQVCYALVCCFYSTTAQCLTG
ncbi:unnamed protein product [Ceratitis capitata]|uniref:(Mediterranean fruit fly) hypothetical protein n=1 Tax=Ceratitis capitata TaxID=7213 RepID=A0A811UMK0_CERCA|nr:unnamed protein product [Ceratitis capitata]